MSIHACRLVTLGQLFAVEDPTTDPLQELLRVLCSAPTPGLAPLGKGIEQRLAGQPPAPSPSFLWFKVTAVEPHEAMPLAVDPQTTAVNIEVTP